MAIDLNDEILQDFLVEAGEILEQLNEQLVNLELSPEDSDLLNSIFRGFHTIKGGGSFLALTNLVEVCHKSEDVFDRLRNKELTLDAAMMDVFLRVLDAVNQMFEEIREGTDPGAADPELLQQLLVMQQGEGAAKSTEDSIEPESESAERQAEDNSQTENISDSSSEAAKEFMAGDDDITDDEFESLLDALQGKCENSAAQNSAGSDPVKDTAMAAGNGDEMTEEEFDALLDNLHGSGAPPKVDAIKPSKAPKADKSVSASNEISDDEFESLLDEMHGKGQGPGSGASTDRMKPADKRVAANTSGPKASEAPKAPEKPAAPSAKPTKGESTVRVDTSRLDDIMNLVGELVLARNRLNTLKESFEDERVHEAISNLDVVTGDLQTAVMKTRMQPVKKVFGRFPRVVRDLARSLKKEVNLEMIGEETGLDKNLVEALADPLVHLVRNSVDHGIELPDVREAAGKTREGTVVLAAQQEGDHIILSISDDGAGMNPEVLRNNAIEKGLMDAESASRLDEKGCFDLIFMPGLSTKQEISDVSGRGVGMDVVKTKISQLNGMIDISSTLGKGTVLKIRVPLTLAILPTLMVRLGSRKFALPLSNVSEIFELSSKKTSVVDGKDVVLNRGKAPPIFHLRQWLLNGASNSEPPPADPQVIMVQAANTQVGLVVDQVLGQEEVVIKPMGAMLHGLPGIAGSTITGDGNIAIILDVQGLLNNYA